MFMGMVGNLGMLRRYKKPEIGKVWQSMLTTNIGPARNPTMILFCIDKL